MTRVLSTTVPFGFDFDTRRFIDAYKALGCVSGQFYRNPLDPPSASEARKMAEEANFPFDSTHGIFGWRYDPSSPDAHQREFCLRTYEVEGLLARDVGEPIVVVHPSGNTKDLVPYPREQAVPLQEARWDHLDDFLKRLADIGERLGVTYAIENVPFVFPLGHDAPALAARVLNVGSERIRMCFDTGHAHITGSTADDLARCAEAIVYVHINDNNGVEDSHFMPGDGTIDWAAFAESAEKHGVSAPMMLEVFYPEAQIEKLAREGFGMTLSSNCATAAA